LVVLAVVGCGGNTNVGQVSGTVTYQGQPLPFGTVSFLDSGNQPLASSAINDGTYAMPVKVPVGPVKVIVTTPGRVSGRLPKKKSGESITVISIPARYGKTDSSGLTYTVKPGPNEYKIDLQ
jgi:hypothetical protein